MLSVEMIEAYLVVLSLRFFFFDFIIFEGIRENFRKNINSKLFHKWLDCPFCHGFWCGIFVYLVLFDISVIHLIVFGFNSAILSLMWSVYFIPLLIKYGELSDETKLI